MSEQSSPVSAFRLRDHAGENVSPAVFLSPSGNLAGRTPGRKRRTTSFVREVTSEEAGGFELVYHNAEGHDERFRVTAAGLLLGRGEHCDVRLTERFVSRQHARIWVEDGQLWIRDMGSSNGIKINGKRVMGGNISQGAELWVGVARLSARAVTASTVREARISLREAPGVEEEIVHDTDNGRLGTLYRAAQLLATVFDAGELHRRLLGLALSAVPARRGYVIERAADGAVAVLAHQSVDSDGQGPPLSRTLIGEATGRGDAVMTLDAQQDERFAGALSVVSHAIHAAMCVPLVGRQGICGAIYVDSGAQPGRFTAEDLEMLTAVGRIAGVALENTRLHREAVERERLAALGMATANLGHCMKNILTGFRCGGEFLGSGVAADDMATVKRGWTHVSRCIDRIDGLVMNMLTFGRADRRWSHTAADVRVAIAQAIDAAKPRAERYNVTLEMDMPEGPLAVIGDTQELFRVFLNLITNAIDACMELGGQVRVIVSICGDDLEVRVRDNGPGIPQDVQEKLFGPFFSTKGSSGTGLGLSTAKKIVEEHGGRIALESVPGEGAVFCVRLPRTLEAAAPAS